MRFKLSNFIWPHGCKKSYIFNIFFKEYAKSSRKRGVAIRGVIKFKSCCNMVLSDMVGTNGPKPLEKARVLKFSQMCHGLNNIVFKKVSFQKKCNLGVRFKNLEYFQGYFDFVGVSVWSNEILHCEA